MSSGRRRSIRAPTWATCGTPGVWWCCREPGTTFGPVEEPTTYFIRPGPGHCLVMAKWGKAIVSCPDHVEQVTARLAEMHGVNL